MSMNVSQLPNLITLARLALAPAFVLLLNDRDYTLALAVFVIAGVSDGLDGFIAKRFHYESRLGAILDPVADKVLLVSAYVMLTVLDHLPLWLVIVVVFRDLLIVGGYVAYTSLYGPVHMRPSWISKLNTFMQIALVVIVLFEQAIATSYPSVIALLVYAVLITTIASGGHYLWAWGIMKDIEQARAPQRHE
ncbi:MAG TPA: CDP-alcohol phosphatidyltransferase family protein [Burkholderiales bacterium]|jgi:cardiolipin synthase